MGNAAGYGVTRVAFDRAVKSLAWRGPDRGRTRPPDDKNALNERLIPQGQIFVEGQGTVSSDLASTRRKFYDSTLKRG